MARRSDETRKTERDERLREAAARAGGFEASRAYGEPRPRDVSGGGLRHVWGGEGERGPLGAGAAGASGALERADPFTHDHRGLVESGYLQPGEEPARRGGHTGRGPKGYRWSDERLHEELCERLTADPLIDAREVEVAVDDRRVTLAGRVPVRTRRDRAEDLAAGLPGVVEVVNELRVRRDDAG